MSKVKDFFTGWGWAEVVTLVVMLAVVDALLPKVDFLPVISGYLNAFGAIIRDLLPTANL